MPLFTAVSGSAQHFHRLLRCLNFTSKAQVQLSKDGVRFSVEESRAIQGLAFLDKSLFTSFRFDEPPASTDGTAAEGESEPFTLQISLPALLETLSIFGATDTGRERFGRDPYTSGIAHARSAAASTAFDSRTLGMAGLCRIHYRALGDPLNITLEEGNMTTTCALTTYEADDVEDIPFDRDALTLKVIMRSSLLHDAVQEVSSAGADRLTLACTPASAGRASLSLSATGPLGSVGVELHDAEQLLDTFQCTVRHTNAYKFSMIKAASRAMALASKVSVRMDVQGVLSLQFMIEMAETEGSLSFVDFRFVPLVSDEEDDENGMDADGNYDRRGVSRDPSPSNHVP